MALVNQPPILASSFAVNGDKNTIPTTNSGTEGLASLSLGFPPITQQPVTQGGIPPQRADFNGIFNLITNFLMFIQNGSIFAYSSTLDYQPPAIVYGNNALYRCIATNGANTSAGVQSLSNTSYWQPLIPVGGITVSGNTITVINETGTEIQYTIDTITNPPSQSDSSNKIVTSAWVKAYAPTKTGVGASGTWGININGTAKKIDNTATDGSDIDLVTGTMANNDYFRIRIGGSNDAGYAEIATADNGNEPIYIRQYGGSNSGFSDPIRTATILDGSGNTSFPGKVTANGGFSGNLTGNATSATKATQDNDGKAINTTYLKRSGGKMDGALNLANNTLNLAGDDCYFGDQDIAGGFCLKGANGATNLTFIDKDNAAQKASLSYTGGNLISSATIQGNLSGTATNATNATNDQNGTNISTGFLNRNRGDIPSGNFDSAYTEGLYTWGDTETNRPCNWGRLLTLNTNYNTTGNWIWQLAFPTRNDNLRLRSRTNGEDWLGWRTIPFTDSPSFSGSPTAPTPGTSDNGTRIATTAFVKNNVVEIIKKVYPVGSIYMSTVSTNPATLFGFGTWEAMPAGRVLLAQGKSSWGTTYNAGSTGGEATHQLTVGELPAHNHTASTNTTGNHTHNVTIFEYYEGGNGWGLGTYKNGQYWQGARFKDGCNEQKNTTNWVQQTGNHSHTLTIGNTGNGQAFNVTQPYLAVYIWKRIS